MEIPFQIASLSKAFLGMVFSVAPSETGQRTEKYTEGSYIKLYHQHIDDTPSHVHTHLEVIQEN